MELQKQVDDSSSVALESCIICCDSDVPLHHCHRTATTTQQHQSHAICEQCLVEFLDQTYTAKYYCEQNEQLVLACMVNCTGHFVSPRNEYAILEQCPRLASRWQQVKIRCVQEMDAADAHKFTVSHHNNNNAAGYRQERLEAFKLKWYAEFHKLYQPTGAENVGNIHEQLRVLKPLITQCTSYFCSDILNLHCPYCDQVFIDYDGCNAVTCENPDCKMAFCGLCLMPCGADAHSHVFRHHGREQLFSRAEKMQECQQELVAVQAAQFLSGLDHPILEFLILSQSRSALATWHLDALHLLLNQRFELSPLPDSVCAKKQPSNSSTTAENDPETRYSCSSSQQQQHYEYCSTSYVSDFFQRYIEQYLVAAPPASEQETTLEQMSATPTSTTQTPNSAPPNSTPNSTTQTPNSATPSLSDMTYQLNCLLGWSVQGKKVAQQIQTSVWTLFANASREQTRPLSALLTMIEWYSKILQHVQASSHRKVEYYARIELMHSNWTLCLEHLPRLFGCVWNRDDHFTMTCITSVLHFLHLVCFNYNEKWIGDSSSYLSLLSSSRFSLQPLPAQTLMQLYIIMSREYHQILNAVASGQVAGEAAVVLAHQTQNVHILRHCLCTVLALRYADDVNDQQAELPQDSVWIAKSCDLQINSSVVRMNEFSTAIVDAFAHELQGGPSKCNVYWLWNLTIVFRRILLHWYLPSCTTQQTNTAGVDRGMLDRVCAASWKFLQELLACPDVTSQPNDRSLTNRTVLIILHLLQDLNQSGIGLLNDCDDVNVLRVQLLHRVICHPWTTSGNEQLASVQLLADAFEGPRPPQALEPQQQPQQQHQQQQHSQGISSSGKITPTTMENTRRQLLLFFPVTTDYNVVVTILTAVISSRVADVSRLKRMLDRLVKMLHRCDNADLVLPLEVNALGVAGGLDVSHLERLLNLPADDTVGVLLNLLVDRQMSRVPSHCVEIEHAYLCNFVCTTQTTIGLPVQLTEQSLRSLSRAFQSTATSSSSSSSSSLASSPSPSPSSSSSCGVYLGALRVAKFVFSNPALHTKTETLNRLYLELQEQLLSFTAQQFRNAVVTAVTTQDELEHSLPVLCAATNCILVLVDSSLSLCQALRSLKLEITHCLTQIVQDGSNFTRLRQAGAALAIQHQHQLLRFMLDIYVCIPDLEAPNVATLFELTSSLSAWCSSTALSAINAAKHSCTASKCSLHCSLRQVSFCVVPLCGLWNSLLEQMQNEYGQLQQLQQQPKYHHHRQIQHQTQIQHTPQSEQSPQSQLECKEMVENILVSMMHFVSDLVYSTGRMVALPILFPLIYRCAILDYSVTQPLLCEISTLIPYLWSIPLSATQSLIGAFEVGLKVYNDVQLAKRLLSCQPSSSQQPSSNSNNSNNSNNNLLHCFLAKVCLYNNSHDTNHNHNPSHQQSNNKNNTLLELCSLSGLLTMSMNLCYKAQVNEINETITANWFDRLNAFENALPPCLHSLQSRLCTLILNATTTTNGSTQQSDFLDLQARYTSLLDCYATMLQFASQYTRNLANLYLSNNPHSVLNLLVQICGAHRLPNEFRESSIHRLLLILSRSAKLQEYQVLHRCTTMDLKQLSFVLDCLVITILNPQNSNHNHNTASSTATTTTSSTDPTVFQASLPLPAVSLVSRSIVKVRRVTTSKPNANSVATVRLPTAIPASPLVTLGIPVLNRNNTATTAAATTATTATTLSRQSYHECLSCVIEMILAVLSQMVNCPSGNNVTAALKQRIGALLSNIHRQFALWKHSQETVQQLLRIASILYKNPHLKICTELVLVCSDASSRVESKKVKLNFIYQVLHEKMRNSDDFFDKWECNQGLIQAAQLLQQAHIQSSGLQAAQCDWIEFNNRCSGHAQLSSSTSPLSVNSNESANNNHNNARSSDRDLLPSLVTCMLPLS